MERPCEICGAEAKAALQVRWRRLGRGSRTDTQISGSVLLCETCVKKPQVFTGPLVDQAADLLKKSYKPTRPRGPGLFASSEVVQ